MMEELPLPERRDGETKNKESERPRFTYNLLLFTNS